MEKKINEEMEGYPENIKVAVGEHLKKHNNSKIIHTSKTEARIYKDQSKGVTTYKVFVEDGHSYIVFKCSENFLPDFEEVMKNTMTKDEINVFLDHSLEFENFTTVQQVAKKLDKIKQLASMAKKDNHPESYIEWELKNILKGKESIADR
ncbi:hypothetical protein [Desulforamulus ruminis]|uniref:Uncharacterized protein n=1 Tax=Desulforamulus ruminis (strain ATCC 23193 / DSM 2154 / NCIMB 8452 / DL) TaxID=696281 RepID=F6DTY8_DESRL|nr:hypothetical protein [Desulforamulus ruminis]AEG59006.1 hypothetical protein Desru_0723 [Desulforamulus ruminis DSM 2154]